MKAPRIVSVALVAMALGTATSPVHSERHCSKKYGEHLAILVQDLKFEGRTVTKCLVRRDLETLLDLKPGYGEGGRLILDDSGDKRKWIKFFTCRQYRDALRKGVYALGTKAMPGPPEEFVNTCDLLFDLAKARAPAKTFLPAGGLTRGLILRFPASFLPSATGDEEERLKELSRKSVTLGDLVKQKKLEVTGGSNGVPIDIDHEEAPLAMRMKLLAYSDFDRDEIQDMLVFFLEYAKGGSYAVWGTMWITVRKRGGPPVIIPESGK